MLNTYCQKTQFKAILTNPVEEKEEKKLVCMFSERVNVNKKCFNLTTPKFEWKLLSSLLYTLEFRLQLIRAVWFT